MTSYSKTGIVVVIVVLFAAVGLIQQHISMHSMEYGPESDPGPALPDVPSELPRLVNLKTEACIHCKRMIPVLEELQRQFTDKFTIYTFDVQRNQRAGTAFGVIRTLPTLVFMDQAGRELFRFEGYMSKAEILDRWRRLGLQV
ncbi:MAG TPA: thioredoxin [Desulfonatronum sp.]|nr:thioredoxin [Desulfonatronum sp.]